jgi:hypothetical protein
MEGTLLRATAHEFYTLGVVAGAAVVPKADCYLLASLPDRESGEWLQIAVALRDEEDGSLNVAELQERIGSREIVHQP